MIGNTLKEVLISEEVQTFAEESGLDKDTVVSLCERLDCECQSESSSTASEGGKYTLACTKSHTGSLDLVLTIETIIFISKHKFPASVPKNDKKGKSVPALSFKRTKAISTFGIEWSPDYNTFRMRFKLYSYKGFGGYRWTKSVSKSKEALIHILDNEIHSYKEQGALVDGTVLLVDPNDVPLNRLEEPLD
jgi:hypothetical protein